MKKPVVKLNPHKSDGVTRRGRGMRAKPKFRAGQVVMVRDQGSEYPCKLDRLTTIGDGESGFRWIDTLHNVEYEKRMRPLNRRERGQS